MVRAALFLLSFLTFGGGFSLGQTPASSSRISADEALDLVMARNVLTHNGKPFHALLQITEEHGDPAYMGTVELFWAAMLCTGSI